jgi:hypothetical protein
MSSAVRFEFMSLLSTVVATLALSLPIAPYLYLIAKSLLIVKDKPTKT